MLVPEEIMKAMILHCKQYLTPNGKIIFVHNLFENKQ